MMAHDRQTTQTPLARADWEVIAICFMWMNILLVSLPVIAVVAVYFLIAILPDHHELLLPAFGIGGAAGWAIAIVSTIVVVRTTNRLYRTSISVLCGILTFIPYTAWFVILIINLKTRKRLRENGAKVGWFRCKLPEENIAALTAIAHLDVDSTHLAAMDKPIAYQNNDITTLKQLAMKSRYLTSCTIAYISFFIIMSMRVVILPASESNFYRGIILISDVMLLAIIVTSAIFVVVIARELYGTMWAILYALLALLPLVGLALMFFMNYRVRKYLHTRGVALDFFGGIPGMIGRTGVS